MHAYKTVILVKLQPFHQNYRSWRDDGLTLRNARRNLARRLAGVMWGVFKSGDFYHPELVGGLNVDGGHLRFPAQKRGFQCQGGQRTPPKLHPWTP